MTDERDEIQQMRLDATLLHTPKKIVCTVKRLYSPSTKTNVPRGYLGRGLLIDLDSIQQREALNRITGERIEFTSVNWFDVNGEDRGWLPADIFFE